MTNLTAAERENIENQAKKILTDFAKSLDTVKFKDKKEKKTQNLGFREEGNGKAPNSEFRKIMFENAPNKNEDNLLAETKKW